MPRKVSFLHVALLTLLMAAGACTPARNDMNTPTVGDASARASDAAEIEAPRRKLNPGPKRAYTITLTINDAPGPFGSVEGVAQYDVENYLECGKINPHTGVAYRMPSMEAFKLQKVSDREYQGTIHTDLIQDEDYYGRGVCRWKLTAVEVQLKATGAPAETRFLPDMKDEQVLAQESVTKYFWKARYPRSKTDNFPSFGEIDRRKFSSEITDGALFTISLSATEARP